MNIPPVSAAAAGQIPAQTPSLPAQSAAQAATTAVENPVQPSAAAKPADKAQPDAGTNIAPDSKELRQALEDVQAAIKPVANQLTFSIDEDTGRTLIKIVDSETDELIRQIPSEELLRISKALDKLQGLLLKQEA